MDQQPTLAQMVKQKYPGVYDQIGDVELEQMVRQKYPGVYDQVPSTQPEQRGFWSATREMVAGIPSAVKSAAEMAAHGLTGDYMWVGQKAAELGSSITPRAMQLKQQGYGMGGYPAAIVRTVGEQMGVPSEAIAEDWRQRNIKALAGDIAAPFIVGGVMHGTTKAVAPALEKVRAAQLARASEQQINTLTQATEGHVPINVEPTLWREKLTTVAPLMEEAANSNAPITTIAGKTDHWSPSLDGVQGARNKVDWGIRNREQQIDQQLQPYANVKLPVNLFQRVMQSFGGSDLPADVRVKAQQAANDALRREGIRPNTEVTVESGNALLHKLNAAIRNVMADTKSSVNDVRQNNATFAANEIMAKSLRDALYDTAENLGVENVRETRRLIGDAIEVRNVFQDMIHKGETGVGQPSAARRIMAAGAGAAVGALPGVVTSNPVVAQIGASGGAIVGGQIAKAPTVNALIDRAFARPTERPQAPAPMRAPYRLNAAPPPETPTTEKYSPWKGVTAETLIDMIDPNGQPKRVPANQVHDMIQQGWTGPQVPSEIDVAELGRPKAPPPNMPTKVESGHGTQQARELGGQTRVPGGQFEPSPLTFGGRTAEPGVPFTTAAGERLGGPVVGSYDTIKVSYPDLPAPKLGGKYPVQFPDGSTKTFSNASAAKTARELVARWIQEFGK